MFIALRLALSFEPLVDDIILKPRPGAMVVPHRAHVFRIHRTQLSNYANVYSIIIIDIFNAC